MSWIDRLRNVVVRGGVDRDIDEELQFHLDERVRENIASGMGDDEARHDAARRFGSRLAAAEQAREANTVVALNTVIQDIGFACRALRKHPSFALAAILTLALGIGANTAIFTVVYHVLLRPLRFSEPNALFVLSDQAKGGNFWVYPGLADVNYLKVRDANHFAFVESFSGSSATLTGAGDPVRVVGATVTPGFFRMLRVTPAHGRDFAASDGQAGQPPVVLLGDALWRSRFGGSADIVGRTIALDAVAHTVIGVMPAGFSYPAQAQVWTPLVVRITPGLGYSRPTIARLKPSATREQAQAAFAALLSQQEGTSGTAPAESHARVIPLKDAVVGDVRRPLLILAGAVALVLLIACANVSNLLLMRAVARRQEIATRLALGAGRGRVIRQLLTESAVMAVCGGAIGMLITIVSVPALLAMMPPGQLPRSAEIQVDGWVLVFLFGVAIASGLALAVFPALHATRVAASGSWRENTSWTTRRPDAMRHLLVAGEIALALMLLVGAGLLVRSFTRLTSVDPGFQPERVMTMTVTLPGSSYTTIDRLQEFHTRLLAPLARTPDAIAVGAVNWRPLGDLLVRGDVQLPEGRDIPSAYRWVTKAGISPGYFRAAGIRLIRGRDFTAADDARSTGVVIVSEWVARRLWPREDALGQRLSVMSRPKPSDWLTVVGVVADIRQSGLKAKIVPAVYQPYQQISRPFFLSQMTFLVRTDGDPQRVGPVMRTALAEVDRNLAPQSIVAMEDLVAATVAEPRFQTRLLVIFSILALTLAAIGVYGVLAASVAERRREIGVRIALGAERHVLVKMVLRRVMTLTGAGVALGATGALALGSVLTRLLFEIEPTDAPTFAATAIVIAAVALLAGAIPAARASSVDPLTALREE